METSKWDQAFLKDPKALENWLYGPQSLQGATRGWFISWLEKHKKKSILDAGCGGGVTAYHLEQNLLLDKYRYTGVDGSKAMLELAKSKVKGSAEWILMDLSELNLQKKFDIILLRAVIEHINDPKVQLEKVCMHLARNGWLIIIFWNNPVEGDTILGGSSIGAPDNAHSREYLQTILTNCGMKIVEELNIEESAARGQNQRTIWLVKQGISPQRGK